MTRPESVAHPFVVDQDRRGILLALSAGAAVPFFSGCAAPGPGTARGFAHLGVLRVLEREGWRPDLVVGTSAGAIVGAMYASGLSVAEIATAVGG